MITADFTRTMARYAAWQNASQIAAADGLTDAARWQDRGAFFGSIFGTLNHLLWGDQVWLHRFAGTPKPAGKTIADTVRATPDWPSFTAARRDHDARIADWAAALTDADLAGDLTWYSGAVQREVTKPKALLVTHFFNHQTHHRGQIHAMLTAAGAAPDDTDLFLIPE
ncbi:MAG: DinB family protein [Pseudomonadota bacterium]